MTVGTASRGHENQPLDGPTYETRRTYDGEGSLLSMTYPGTGRVLTTERDALERVTAINRTTGGSSVEIASYTYIGGRVKSASFENDTKVDYSYDALKRVTGITHKKTTGAQETVAGFAYGWDRSSHRRYEYRAAAGGRSAEASVYTYDSAYRLTRADHQVPVGTALGLASNVAGPPSITPSSVHDAWVYSEAGNRSSHTRDGTTTNYSQSTASSQRNEYSAIGAVTQTHDDNGNLTGAGGITRRFDEANNLVEDDSGPDPVAYRYDALGRRMAKEIDLGSSVARTTYAYDGGAQVLGEFQSTGAQSKEFTYGGLDSPILMEDVPSGDRRYYASNSLGSIAALSDEQGDIVEQYSYRPFGETTIFNASGTDITGSTSGAGNEQNPYRFQGRRFDYEEGTGLYFFRTRYLDPAQGRFISKDGIGDWGDPGNVGNGMTYCGNDPVNCVDPFGERELMGCGNMDEEYRLRQTERERQNRIRNSGAKPQLPAGFYPKGDLSCTFAGFLGLSEGFCAESWNRFYCSVDALVNWTDEDTARLISLVASAISDPGMVASSILNSLWSDGVDLDHALQTSDAFGVGRLVAKKFWQIVGVITAGRFAQSTVAQAGRVKFTVYTKPSRASIWQNWQGARIRIRVVRAKPVVSVSGPRADFGKPNGHHTIPQYMGGRPDQVLVNIPSKVHAAFHEFLDNFRRFPGQAVRTPSPRSFRGPTRPFGRENNGLRVLSHSLEERQFLVNTLRDAYRKFGLYDKVKKVFESEATIYLEGK